MHGNASPSHFKFFLPTTSYASECAYEGEKKLFFLSTLESHQKKSKTETQRAFTHGSSSAGEECWDV